MEKFLFIPPVDDSLGPLKAKQWFLLSASFLGSVGLFFLLESAHGILAFLALIALIIAIKPMQIYAQNRKGRIIGIVFLAIVGGYILYDGRGRIEAQFNQSPFILLMLMSLCLWAYWFTLETAKINQQFLTRMDIMQSRIGSIESKLDRIERIVRKAKQETERDRESPPPHDNTAE